MSRYAANTGVSSDRSRGEIERTLARFKADQFFYDWEQNRAVIGFRIQSRMVRITLALPDRDSRSVTHTPGRGFRRNAKQQPEAYEALVCQRCHSLALFIKAKLDAVEEKISTVKREFLADFKLPSGVTIGKWAKPQLEEVYRSGQIPPMLPR